MTTATAPEALAFFLELAALVTPSGRERATADRCAAYLRDLGLEVDEDDAGRADRRRHRQPLRPARADRRGHADLPLRAHRHGAGVDGDRAAHRRRLRRQRQRHHPRRRQQGDRGRHARRRPPRCVADGIPHAGIEIVLTPQEEVGLQRRQGVRRVAAAPRGSGFVYDHAGPLGGIVMAAPGQNTISLAFRGQAAHAGIAPEQGRSAIAAAAQAIAAMRLGRIDEETTANVGTIARRRGAQRRRAVVRRRGRGAQPRHGSAARRRPPTCSRWPPRRRRDEGCSLETSVREEYAAYRFRRGDRVVRHRRARRWRPPACRCARRRRAAAPTRTSSTRAASPCVRADDRHGAHPRRPASVSSRRTSTGCPRSRSQLVAAARAT